MKPLIHYWRMLTEPSGRDRLMGMKDWKWRVRYPDGKVSISMAYDVACNYADAFGGTVEKVVKKNV